MVRTMENGRVRRGHGKRGVNRCGSDPMTTEEGT